MSYNHEQLEALAMVRRRLGLVHTPAGKKAGEAVAEYLAFRRRLDAFLARRFTGICTDACFRSRRSACCTREGIVIFFADVVVNALASSEPQLNALEQALTNGGRGTKCVFLAETGCLWQVRPIVCAMFLCDPALEEAGSKDAQLAERWAAFEAQRKAFTWPDRPVLFDRLERLFLDAGCRSPLMHLHTSPGLLRIKARAGLLRPD